MVGNVLYSKLGVVQRIIIHGAVSGQMTMFEPSKRHEVILLHDVQNLSFSLSIWYIYYS